MCIRDRIVSGQRSRCGEKEVTSVAEKFGFIVEKGGIFCLEIAADKQDGNVALRDFGYQTYRSCIEGCKICEGEYLNCTEHAKLGQYQAHYRDWQQMCFCESGFRFTQDSSSLTCTEAPVVNCDKKNVFKKVSTQLDTAHLRRPDKIGSWLLNNNKIQKNQISLCESGYLLGGEGIFGNEPVTLQKKFSVRRPHYKVLVRAAIVVINGVFQGEGANVGTVSLEIDGHNVKNLSLTAGHDEIEMCGSKGQNAIKFFLVALVDHTADTLSVSFKGSGFQGSAWGIRNVEVVAAFCSPGCKKCTSCQTCQECDVESGFAQTNGQCRCKAGHQLVQLPGKDICDATNDCNLHGSRSFKLLDYSYFIDTKNTNKINIQIDNRPADSQTDQLFCEPTPDQSIRVLGGNSLGKPGSKVEIKTDKLPPHFALRVTPQIVGVGPITQRRFPEQFALHSQLDGAEVESVVVASKLSKGQTCKQKALNFFNLPRLLRVAKHTSPSLNFTLVSNTQLPEGTFWTLKEIELQVCQCASNCAACTDARTCIQCLAPNMVPGPEGKCVSPTTVTA
eukprot:TRINITY_DN14334_c0_g1_i2.p1 TRINITY_DN14334_c0_g1~~TRINITY_DN14334_c0_g1_i2.p1  ORF type:complete len:560 (+),score=86.97 TRINITY_DN14334_c0_g1_i2:64-1743(+)